MSKQLSETGASYSAGAATALRAELGAAAALRADHDELEKRAAEIIDSIVEGGRSEISDAIAAMRAGILAHLDGEEREIIPAYELHAPDDARSIREEHVAIRKTLDELDIATDLHFLRANVVRDLLAKLRAHAARESTGLYPFALTR